MYLSINLSFILCFSFGCCLAQNNFGARLTAMGKNGAAVNDLWSVDANPSGITVIKSPTVGLNYTKILFDANLSNQAIAFILPIKRNYFGLSIQRYGIAEYNEIKAGFAIAKQFDESLSIGLKGNYHQIKISNYGTTIGFSLDVGANYIYNQELVFGIYVANPSFQNYNNKTIENNIPTIFYIGASYHPSSKLIIATTIIKDVKYALNASLGLDYKLLAMLSLRGGLSLNPLKQYAGFGINYKKIMMDVALESDKNLGYLPQIGLAYAF